MLIAYRNLAFDPTSVITCESATVFSPLGPVSNLADRRLAVPAIATAGTATLEFWVTLAAAAPVKIVAILAHNFVGTMRVTLRGMLLGSEVFTETDLAPWIPAPNSLFPRHMYMILDAAHEVDQVRMEIQQEGTVVTPAVIGALWVSNCFEPEHKTAQRDFNMQTRDDSVVNKSSGQQVYVDYKSRYRQLTATVPALSEEEAIGSTDGLTPNIQDIGFEVGRGGSVIVIPTRSSAQTVNKFGIFGIFLDPPAVRLLDANRAGRIWTTNFDVVETL